VAPHAVLGFNSAANRGVAVAPSSQDRWFKCKQDIRDGTQHDGGVNWGNRVAIQDAPYSLRLNKDEFGKLGLVCRQTRDRPWKRAARCLGKPERPSISCTSGMQRALFSGARGDLPLSCALAQRRPNTSPFHGLRSAFRLLDLLLLPGRRAAEPRCVTSVTAAGMVLRETAGTMILPGICERVRIAGRSGVYIVVSTSVNHQTADVMPLDHVAPLLSAVPFSDIRLFERDNQSQSTYLGQTRRSDSPEPGQVG
jgi:hypothetical protein